MAARTDFSVLETRRIAHDMGAVLPDLVVFKGCVRTPTTKRGGGVLIGIAHQRPAAPLTADGEHLQAALLEPRTARPLPFLQRVAGALWRWA